MNFTNSPYEKMMKQVPRPPHPCPVRKPPRGSPCRDCRFWNGSVCVGLCHRDLIVERKERTSGQHGPMPPPVVK